MKGQPVSGVQHVTKARMYVLHTRSRGNEGGRGKGPEDSMDLSTPLGIDWASRRTIPLNSPWCRWRHSASPARRSTSSFKLICSSPGFAVLNHPRSRFHNSFPDPFLAPRPNPTNQRPRRVTPSKSGRLLCCVNPSRSSGHEFAQRCVLLTSGCLFVSR